MLPEFTGPLYLCIVTQPACNALRSIVIMLGVLPAVVEVEISVGIIHGVLQLQIQRLRLTVHPLVRIEETQLVGAGVGGVVVVIGFFLFISFLFFFSLKKKKETKQRLFAESECKAMVT